MKLGIMDLVDHPIELTLVILAIISHHLGVSYPWCYLTRELIC